MVRRRFLLGTALAVGLLLVPGRDALAQKKNPEGTPVLLLSGGQREHHGYREQAAELARTLEDTGRYRVTLVEDAAILETPALQKYALVIVNADRRDPEFKFSADQQRALLAYVKAGHGYVSIHGADNAPNDWLPEMKDLLGGIYSHFGLPDGKAIAGTYEVKIADPAHPATAGLKDFTLQDELYAYMQMKPDVKPLATITYKGEAFPVAWTYRYGRGPVFHTSLGHRGFGAEKPDPLRDPNLGRLVLQGIDWVADQVKSTAPVRAATP